MEQLVNFFYRLLDRYSGFTQMRYLYNEINWNNQLILIRGPKGSGKTTMLMQHILHTFPDKSKVLYCSVDHFWFASHTLLDLAEYAHTHDVRLPTYRIVMLLLMALTWGLKTKSPYGCSACSTNPYNKSIYKR